MEQEKKTRNGKMKFSKRAKEAQHDEVRGVFQMDSSKKEKRWMLLLFAVGFVK
jgi:hypothetical protein